MKRIGILGHGFIEWGGGLDFLRLICGSLVAASEPVELHLLLPTRGPRLMARRAIRHLKRILGRPVIDSKRPDSRHIVELISGEMRGRLSVHLIDIGSAAVNRAARRLNLDVLLPAHYAPRPSFHTPWLGYIADLQHVHFPQFFSPQEVAVRHRHCETMLNQARCVIVNAQAVVDDIRNAYPNHATNIVALPFAPAPSKEWLSAAAPPLDRYQISENYFIICNQFWQHKDHLTAWRAFAALHDEFPDVQLVCTGETSDFRNPTHFELLKQEAQRLGISANLRILGLIPKHEQIALLRSALAVVQPTLFEGGPGGGAVFDAVALGVPAIVSDISVNLEVTDPAVCFFRQGDAEHLAQRMRDVLQRPARQPATAPELLAAGEQRRRACGDVLIAAATQLRASPARQHGQ